MTGAGWRSEVREALRRDPRGYAEHLFGRAIRERRGELKFEGGNYVVITGRKAGIWANWPAGETGKLIKATAFQFRLSDDDAWKHAAEWYGIDTGDGRAPAGEPRKRREEQVERSKDEANRIAKARGIWAGSVPIAGTLGDRYLREVRRIPAPEAGWPAAVRWHPERRAVVAAATDDAGELRAVHCIRLDTAGRNLRRRDGSKIKLSYGLVKGAAVRLPGKAAGGPVLLAEGLETGLTAWRATGHETLIVLGALARAVPPPGRRSILLRDDDKPGSPADKALSKALAGWRERVAGATPWAEPRGDKSDFNDVVQAEGLGAVARRIRLAELALDRLQPVPAPLPLPSATLAELRQQQREVIRRYLTQRFHEGALPPLLIDGATGSGKTEEVVAWLPTLIRNDKMRRRAHRVLIYTPTIRHGRALAARIAEADADADPLHRLRIEIYRGRIGEEAGADQTCRNMDAINLARQAAAKLSSTVCGQAGADDQCPHRDGCAYFAQLGPAATADVLIVAHNFLFEPLPEQLFEGLSLTVTDEDFTGHGDDIAEVPLRLFERTETPVLARGEPDDAATLELDELLGRIRRVLESGDALPQAVTASGLTRTDLARARKLSWRRKIDDGMQPSMPIADRRAAAKDAASNLDLKLVDTLTRALAEVAPEDDGAPLLGLDPEAGRIEVAGGIATVYGLRKINPRLRDLPTLILSATASPARLRRFFPALESPHLPLPAAPHMSLHQHLGAFGSRNLGKKLDDLALDFRQLVGAERAVVIAPKAHTAELRRSLPATVAIGHHGNVAGDDSHGDVDHLIVLSAPFPKRQDNANRASAEAGRVIPAGRIERVPAAALMADGSGVGFIRPGYADPRLQEAHRQVYDAAIVQAIGRGRGINRTAANPLTVHVFGFAELPLPLASISRWQRPDRIARMADAGIVATNSADMVRLHPVLYPSHDAAEKALYRAGGAAAIEARARQLVAGQAEPWVRVTWQPAGQGHKLRIGFAAHSQVERLRAQLGRLARFEVAPFTAGNRPEKSRTWPIRESSYADMSGSSPDQPAFRVPMPPDAPAQPPRPPPDG